MEPLHDSVSVHVQSGRGEILQRQQQLQNRLDTYPFVQNQTLYSIVQKTLSVNQCTGNQYFPYITKIQSLQISTHQQVQERQRQLSTTLFFLQSSPVNSRAGWA